MSKVIISIPEHTLSELSQADAPWIYELMNDPAYIENIGDRGIASIKEAKDYLINGPIASYRQHGFGLWKAVLRGSNAPIGICGLLQREYLDYPDIGYATLSDFRGRGLTYLAVQLTITYFREHIFSEKLYGLTKLGNRASQNLLTTAGFELLEIRIINGLETVLYKYDFVNRE